MTRLERSCWSLAELRRTLGEPRLLQGDPLWPRASTGMPSVDALLLTSGQPIEVHRLGELSGELLEGLSFASSPEFDSWLLVERRHLAGASGSLTS